MRAGKLDRKIKIQSYSNAVNPHGTPVETWTDFACVRAQIVQTSTEEYLRDYGENAALAIIFRIRWLDGVTTSHRVQYEGRNLNVRQVKEIGRRRGLELRCDEVRS